MLSLLLTSAFAFDRVELCHWDASMGVYAVIEVSTRAVPGHFGHGDSYPALYFADLDGDGYGDPYGATDVCPDFGFVDDDTDCDDTDATVYAGAPELDDLLDNDCDVWVDEDFVAEGDVIFTEIARQAWVGYTSSQPNAQWFEVYNTSDRTVDLSKWYVLRTNGVTNTKAFFVDPAAELLLGPGDYAVFCKTDNFEGDEFATVPLWCDYFWGDETQVWNWAGLYGNNGFTLVRDADRLALYIEGGSGHGRLVDDVRWTWVDGSATNWPREATRSMSLDPTAYDGALNDSYASWCAADGDTWWDSATHAEYGTPGTVNGACG